MGLDFGEKTKEKVWGRRENKEKLNFQRVYGK